MGQDAVITKRVVGVMVSAYALLVGLVMGVWAIAGSLSRAASGCTNLPWGCLPNVVVRIMIPAAVLLVLGCSLPVVARLWKLWRGQSN